MLCAFSSGLRLVPCIRMAASSASTSSSSRAVFVQTLNAMTGRTEWKEQAEDYDYQQEIARAAFADMLHDDERNHKYYLGLEAAIAAKRAEGQAVHVLDIGTGTGLLSMMAAKLGADSVTAVEEFLPMAECAKRVIQANGFSDKIHLIKKRSTAVGVGPGKDMDRRANILVTEVFDTELIGEGAISTFNHAHQELLTSDCIVVPCFATVYAQVVSSDLASRWNSLHPIQCGDRVVSVPTAKSSLSASSTLALHDVQLSQVKQEWFTPISKPVQIYSFDFSGRSGRIPICEQSVVEIASEASGACDAVFFWWEIKMDPHKKITLSCAPKWAHPHPENLPWRDHWMQAVYYPISRLSVEKGDQFSLISNHDEYSYWFDVTKQDKSAVGPVAMPQPSPGLLLAVSRTRLGQINDSGRNAVLCSAMKSALSRCDKKNPDCLFISDLSLAPVLCAVLGAGSVLVFEQNTSMRQVLQDLAAANDISEKLIIKDKSPVDMQSSDIPNKVSLIFGEPNFSLSLLPWHNLLFWYNLHSVLDQIMNPAVVVVPRRAELWAVPVHFADLWKIRCPLHFVEGFQMEHFDNIIMSACSVSDCNVEPHPLWEYPCRAKAKPTKLMEFNLTKAVPDSAETVTKTIELEDFFGNVNGMALWMNWHLGDDHVLSSGPTSDIVVGEDIVWDVHSKQGVFFFPRANLCQKGVHSVYCSVTFTPKEGELNFKFNL